MVRIVLYLYLGSLQSSTRSMLCKMHFESHGSAIVIALESTVYGGFRIAWELWYTYHYENFKGDIGKFCLKWLLYQATIVTRKWHLSCFFTIICFFLIDVPLIFINIEHKLFFNSNSPREEFHCSRIKFLYLNLKEYARLPDFYYTRISHNAENVLHLNNLI